MPAKRSWTRDALGNDSVGPPGPPKSATSAHPDRSHGRLDGRVRTEIHADPGLSELESEVSNLRRALESRTQIGIAIGMLAERYSCTSPQAWALLARLSSHTNIKVAEIARALVALADGTAEQHDAVIMSALVKHLPPRTSRGGPRGAAVDNACGGPQIEGTREPV